MKLKTECILAHVTMRGEKAGDDDGEVASDLKLTGEVLPEDLEDLFATKASFQALLGSLYRDDDELVTADLQSMTLSLDCEKVQANVGSAIASEAATLKFTGCKFNSVTLEPKSGRAVKITARLQVYPSDEQWAGLKHLLRKSVSVSLWGGKQVEATKSDKQASLSLAGGTDTAPGDTLQ